MTVDLWVYGAQVVSMVDGDTARVSLDLGFHCYHVESLRLAWIDCPELFSGTNRDAGRVAKAFAEAWVTAAYLAWSESDNAYPFYVRTLKDKQTFNRYIGWIARSDTGDDLADALVASGHAVRVKT